MSQSKMPNNVAAEVPVITKLTAVDHARLQTPTNFGPLGGETLIKSGGKFDVHICDMGLLVTLKADGIQAIIPMANVKFAVLKK